MATRSTGDDGVVRFRYTPTANGSFRLRSPEVRGTLGPGTSTQEGVYLRR